MRTPIIYPFQINKNFQVGYAWSAELSRRLKYRLTLFTTLDELSPEPVAQVYQALAEAQGFYVKYFQLLKLRLSPVKSERHFLKGEWTSSFLQFVQQMSPGILVLQSDLFSNQQLTSLINVGQKTIVLPVLNVDQFSEQAQDRSHLFIEILGQAAVYNMPASFFKTLSDDHTLFNAITHFFKRKIKPLVAK
jgi:hypothetical protein